MSTFPVILRSGVHLARGDTMEVGRDALVFKGQHFYERTVRYPDIADLEVSEWRGRNPHLPSVPETIMVTFSLSKVPELTGLQKRYPGVEDTFYLTEAFMFDLTRRDEVLAVVSVIEERWRSANPAGALRHVVHDYARDH